MAAVDSRRRFLEKCAWAAAGAALGGLLPRWVPEVSQAGAADDPLSPEARLKALNLQLPALPKGKGTATLVPTVRVGELLFVSGQTPRRPDGSAIVGKVGQDLTVEQARDAARLVGLQVLSTIRAELGSLDKVVRLVKTLGMVNAVPDFKEQPRVINGFSDLMVEVFGDTAGKGARSAIGVGSLPGGAAVEVEAIFQVRGG
ncbi:MAG: RidA family protein [Gemmataceae bacterium]|nr:RidA family protein [Gemmataceae bacterium]MDW8267193.1 RidA family protein [Gemmataceae bacterium]